MVTRWGAFEAERGRLAGWIKLLVVAIQLGLMYLVVELFNLENQGFQNLFLLTAVGFVVHGLLPQQHRLTFFLLLSLGGMAWVLGPINGLWIFGLGLGLIGICHLPLSFGARSILLLLAGGLLVWMRAGKMPHPWSNAIWPLFGSMFMFRLMIYMYDLKHGKTPPGARWTLSYFFLLPNVCFALFPVVDFKKFQSSYFSEDAHVVYQRGAQWIYRGLYQLVLYRFVYSYLTLAAGDVASGFDLMRFAVSSFLLYLQVSGQFHVIVGMLLLFGFNLPETHKRYFLSSSFNDFWRRINIYWKDFMMKLFYYPTYFKVRKLGSGAALVISTAVVFSATWFLHIYQWFWIRGTVLLEWHDTLFWVILGVFVMVNSLYEDRFGRERSLGKAKRSVLGNVALGLRTAATFTILCLLWSFWSSSSAEEWLGLWAQAGRGAVWGAVLLLGGLYGAAWLATRMARQASKAAQAAGSTLAAANAGSKLAAAKSGSKLAAAKTAAKEAEVAKAQEAVRAFWRPAVSTLAASLVLAALGVPQVNARLGEEGSEWVRSLQRSRLNQRDTERLELGYYEHLVGVNRHNQELWSLYSQVPEDWLGIIDTEAWVQTDDLLLGDVVPGSDITFKRTGLKINRWGMRDADVPKEKPPGTMRMAFLGSSHVMGSGVEVEETFASRVEAALGDTVRTRNSGEEDFELLNFAIAGRSTVQHLYVLEQKVVDFEPDHLLLFAHSPDPKMLVRDLIQVVERGVEVPYEELRRILAKAGVEAGSKRSVIERRLKPHQWEIIEWAYGRMGEICRQREIRPIWVFLPMVFEDLNPDDIGRMEALAQQAGFQTIGLTDVYEGYPAKDLRLVSWDNHPNAFAHGLIAERLEAELATLGDELWGTAEVGGMGQEPDPLDTAPSADTGR